jgi:hypothetical protein
MKTAASSLLALVIAAAALCFAAPFPVGTVAQVTPAPTCDILAKEPDKYVGQQVAFFGAVRTGDVRFSGGKGKWTYAIDCKTQDDKVIPDGVFGFVDADAMWSPAATRAKATKDLLKITGVVSGTGKVTGAPGAIPFLTKVQVVLASEVR